MHFSRLASPALLILAILAGCQSSETPKTEAPNRADNLRMVAEGRNTELKYKSDAPGTIIVNNFSKGDYLYKGPIKKGDTFELIPNSSRAMVNKDFVGLDHDTNTHDTYRLYFLPQ